jgi:hypothetical protein
LQLEFEVEEFPEARSERDAIAWTEGMLRVRLEGRIFLETGGILLVEFAIVLKKWLREMRAGSLEDLYYASMDFEEEPILALRLADARGSFMPESAWAEGKRSAISVADATAAAEQYLLDLGTELRRTCGFELEPLLERMTSEGSG